MRERKGTKRKNKKNDKRKGMGSYVMLRKGRKSKGPRKAKKQKKTRRERNEREKEGRKFFFKKICGKLKGRERRDWQDRVAPLLSHCSPPVMLPLL